jgi:hypothetical protein
MDESVTLGGVGTVETRPPDAPPVAHLEHDSAVTVHEFAPHGPQPAARGPITEMPVLSQRWVVVGLGRPASTAGEVQGTRGPAGDESGTSLAVRGP